MPFIGSLVQSLFVIQNPNQTKKTPSPPQTQLWSRCTDKVFTIVEHIWQPAEFWCFCNVAGEVVLVIAWNDCELKLKALSYMFLDTGV